MGNAGDGSGQFVARYAQLRDGITFVCSDGGMFTAVDTATGKPLWEFQTNAAFHTSPMTYVFDGKQYVAIAAGGNLLAFGLVE